MKKTRLRRVISCMILFFFVVGFVSCGYFLHPERRGRQKARLIGISYYLIAHSS